MDENITLATLLRDHPEWADRPLVIMNGEGIYEYVGAPGSIYTDFDQDENLDVLVIAEN